MAVGSLNRVKRGPAALALGSALRENTQMAVDAKLGQTLAFMDWALKVPEPKAGKLDFDRFPPQVQLYEVGVTDRECVVKKGTQVGMSAWAVRWALYHADTKGWTGFYLFPTQRDMWDFSTLRIGPIIRGSKHLRERQAPDDPNNKGMKGIGLGTVVFRGSESVAGLESVDADHMVFDEYDLLDHANIPVAERRTGGSQHSLYRRLGWPSIPNTGIAKLYEDSDQRRWNVKCDGCGLWQDIDFFKNVDEARMLRVCRDCRKPLDVRKGEWVAAYPDRDTIGWHVHRLILPEIRLDELVKSSKKRGAHEVQSFMNRDLGLEYAPEEGRLSDAAYDAAVSAGGGYFAARNLAEAAPVTAQLVTMGIDVASVRNLNVRVSEHFEDGTRRALFVGEVENFNDLDELWRRFGVNMGCIDHLPEGRLARAFANRHLGQVYLVALNDPGASTTAPQAITVDDDMYSASVNRTMALDAMLEEIRGQVNVLPANAPDDYKAQLQAPNRMVIGTEKVPERGEKLPTKTRVFYRSSGPDDYAMAEVFDLVAKELWSRRLGIEAVTKEQYTPLDDMLEFERSHNADYKGDGSYYPGGRDDGEF